MMDAFKLPMPSRFRAIRVAIENRKSPEMEPLLEHLQIIEQQFNTLQQENTLLKSGGAL